MAVIDPGVAVREILRLYPATLSVFGRFKVDLCCEAGLPLSVAASQHKLDLNQLLKELIDAAEAQPAVK